jgi:hypothetical protein
MMLVRQTFQAKYGHGDELVEVFKEFNALGMGPSNQAGRILTDASGPFFTVIAEYEVENFAAWEESFKKLMDRPEMGELFGRMMLHVESGSRDFFNIVE